MASEASEDSAGSLSDGELQRAQCGRPRWAPAKTYADPHCTLSELHHLSSRDSLAVVGVKQSGPPRKAQLAPGATEVRHACSARIAYSEAQIDGMALHTLVRFIGTVTSRPLRASEATQCPVARDIGRDSHVSSDEVDSADDVTGSDAASSSVREAPALRFATQAGGHLDSRLVPGAR